MPYSVSPVCRGPRAEVPRARWWPDSRATASPGTCDGPSDPRAALPERSRLSHATQQAGEAGVAPQGVETRMHPEAHHHAIPILERALQPGERLVVVAQRHVDVGDRIRGDLARAPALDHTTHDRLGAR